MVRLLSKAGRVAKVNEPLYYYRQQATSIMHNMSRKTEQDELWVYSDIIQYLKKEEIYEPLKQSMAWRSLKASQEMAIDPERYHLFKHYNPEKNAYIFSCPSSFINFKLKVIMWCLTHGLTPMASIIVKTRKLLGR